MVAKTKNHARPWQVLIAEDDLKCRADLLKSFSPFARCTTVHNGEEALTAYRKALKKKSPFDFILLDITMPNVNGFEVLRTIRHEEESGKSAHPTRIIMVTTYKDSLMENYNMGWDEFITKPVNTEILIGKMKQMFKPPAGI